MSAHNQHRDDDVDHEEEEAMLDPAEAGEEIEGDDEDVPMESDDEEDPGAPLEEIQLQNDSIAHFDHHKDSIFCIAQHPIHPTIVATGGGDDVGYVFDSTPLDRPVLPPSYESDPQPKERESLPPLFQLSGHTDSVNAITYTLPQGAYLATAGLDGQVRVWRASPSGREYSFLGSSSEVEEINWLAACPDPKHANALALGASDGSVWIYTISADDTASPLTIAQAFYLHGGACTAGAWTPDGRLLCTVAEDGSFYVWDAFGEAAAAGVAAPGGGQAVVGLTAADDRFRVDGGLYSVAVSPNGAFAAVGGADGHIRIVGLPRVGAGAAAGTVKGGAGAKSKAGGKSAAAASSSPGAGQPGQILASLQPQSDGVETLAFSAPPLTLMAAGSVDGSIALFDTAHRFAVRRHIRSAHEDEAVIKVDFVRDRPGGGWLLTSCGNDGVVRRWDTRGGTAAAEQGIVGEWRGHRGGGEGGGVLGFVQGGGGARIVTAGDDGVALVFNGEEGMRS